MNNCDVTLFCSYIDNNSGKKAYRRIYFYKADWQQNLGVKYLKYTKSSMNTSSDITIFIPYREDLQYITPKRYQQLEDKEGYYTFNIHDKIVKGIIDFDIDSPTNLKLLETKFDDVVDILRVEDCEMLKHFELECE